MNHFCNAKFYTRERKKGSTKLTKSMVNTVLLTDLRSLPKTKKNLYTQVPQMLLHCK